MTLDVPVWVLAAVIPLTAGIVVFAMRTWYGVNPIQEHRREQQESVIELQERRIELLEREVKALTRDYEFLLSENRALRKELAAVQSEHYQAVLAVRSQRVDETDSRD